MLPLETSRVKRIAVIGDNAKIPCVSGGGSASMKTLYAVSSLQAIRKLANDRGISVDFAIGVFSQRYLPLLDDLVSYPTGVAGKDHLQFFVDDPRKNVSAKPVHEKVVTTSNNFMVRASATLRSFGLRSIVETA